MAADAEISLEARLRDLVTSQLSKMEAGIVAFGVKANKSMSYVQRAAQDAKNGIIDMAKRFGPAAIAASALFGAMRKIGDAIDFVREKSQDFEKTMSNIKAVLRPSVKEFSTLSDEAKRLGESTSFSASQAGAAFLEMGKLGFKTSEILKSVPNVLDLAALSGSGLANSAEVVVKTLNQFNESAEESNRLSDVMAKSFVSSALDMDKFRESMKYVGTSARLAGLDIEQTTALLSVLADNGIEASMAGTSLNQMLTELIKPSSKVNKELDRLGMNSSSINEKIKNLSKSGIDVAGVFEFLDVRAARSANVILGNVDAVEKLEKEYRNAKGSAKEMAKTMLDNVAGATVILESAQEGLGIAIGEAFGADKKRRIEFYTKIIGDATKFVKEHQEELKTLAKVFSTTLITSIKMAAGALEGLYITISTILDPISKLTKINEDHIKNMDKLTTALDDLEDVKSLIKLREQFDELKNSGKDTSSIINQWGVESKTISDEMVKINQQTAAIMGKSFLTEEGNRMNLDVLKAALKIKTAEAEIIGKSAEEAAKAAQAEADRAEAAATRRQAAEREAQLNKDFKAPFLPTVLVTPQSAGPAFPSVEDREKMREAAKANEMAMLEDKFAIRELELEMQEDSLERSIELAKLANEKELSLKEHSNEYKLKSEEALQAQIAKIKQEYDKKVFDSNKERIKKETDLRQQQLDLALSGLSVASALAKQNKDLIPILNAIKVIELAIATIRAVSGATSPLGQASGVLGGVAGLINLFGGFSSGGIIPGNPGEPRMIVAHGGERINSDRAVQNNYNITYSPTTSFSGAGGVNEERILDVLERQPERLKKIIDSANKRGF